MNKKDSLRIKIALVINLIIVAFTIFACVVLFTGFKFMNEVPIIESTKPGMFKFFTTDSNIFMGIVAAIFAVYQILILTGKKTEIPNGLYIVKLAATSAVALTLSIVFCYLGIIVYGGVGMLLKNSSLFFHLINPVLSIINFAFFESTNKIKFKKTLWGIIPAVLYAVFYLTNVLLHAQNGRVSSAFDFYNLIQGGLWQICFVLPLLLAIAYGISVALWATNRTAKHI